MLDYKRFTIPDGLIASSSADGMLILKMDTDEVYELNPVSGAFWEAVETHEGNAQRVFSDLRNKYEVEDDRLKDDLEKLIAFLVSEGLLNAD